jgi:cytosine/adenosine deaminase-related metal-dependent hydrolase
MWLRFVQLKAVLATLLLSTSTTATASPILFTDATIIAFDAGSNRTKTLRDSSLLVENDTIAQIYNGNTPTSFPNGTEVVNATGKIISPGFIDTHHHLWQTAFKSIASNVTLSEYFQKYGEFGPTIQYMSAEDKYLSQLTGCLELLNAGTTTVLDHAHGDSSPEAADAIINGTVDSGVRAFHAFAVHNVPNWTVPDQMQKLRDLANDRRLSGDGVVSLGLSYDQFDGGPENVTSQLWGIVR